MDIKVIGNRFTCLGFSLTGIETAVAEERDKIEDEFDRALKQEGLGLILITEKEADFIRDRVDKQKTEGEMPLVVEIPSRDGWESKGKALKLINRVLSIKI